MRNFKKKVAVFLVLCIVTALGMNGVVFGGTTSGSSAGSALTVLAAATSKPAVDDKYTYGYAAIKLNGLKLYDGTSKTSFVPDLGKSVDIQTGITLFVKALGKDKAALAMTKAKISSALSKYKDNSKISASARPYVAYAVANKLYAGATSTTIGPTGAMTGQAYALMILRALGDQTTKIDKSLATLQGKGGLTAAEVKKFNNKKLTRDEWVGMTFGALNAKTSNGKLLVEKLIAEKVITEAAAKTAGVYKGSFDPFVNISNTPNAKITDVVVYDIANSSKWSVETGLKVGDKQYGDRDFTFTDIPAKYKGSDWIKAACDSKKFTGASNLCSFKVQSTGTVYILYSDAIKTKPEWLTSNFKLTGDKVKTSDSGSPIYNVYQKACKAGDTLTLGLNGSVDEKCYTVLFVKSGTSIISDLVCYDKDNAAKWSIASNMRVGVEQYGDRKFLLTGVPAKYADCDWIKTACSSKIYTGEELCQFKVTADSTVYILYSDVITEPVGWLTKNFTKNKDQFKSDDGGGPTYSVYERNFPAGSTITLGNNGNHDEKCYTIIVKKYTGASLGASVKFTATSKAAAATKATTIDSSSAYISDVTVNDAETASFWSVKTNLKLGQDQYADRPGRTFDKLPAAYLGCDWIQAACDAKKYTGDALCTFKVSSNVTVYILHSDVVRPLPSWLSSFKDTGDNMVNAQGGAAVDTYSIYSKTYTAGSTVTLGNNGSADEAGYTILVKRN